MAQQNIIQKFLNRVAPAGFFGATKIIKERDLRNLNTIISPVQLDRLRHDIAMWREAKREEELAYYPHRVKEQRLFLDTILNGHVSSCIERRKDLTLLREFEIQDENGKRLEDVEKLFKNEWFDLFVNYSLDAMFFGYTLIKLGDIENDCFKNLGIIRRWNISPERKEVTTLIYSLTGISFMEGEAVDWHVWIPTPSETGISDCGTGLLYKVALYEIFLRNLLGYNGDFVELYSQPYRVGKTMKTEESERAELEHALQSMGSNGYAVLDPNDTIEFLETSLGGTGWQGYDNLEQRCEKKISKLILGHSDAMDSTAGKLGSEQGGEESPTQTALNDKQAKDGKFIESIVNGQLIPKMMNLGFNLPLGIRFVYSNNSEVEKDKNKKADYAIKLSTVAGNLKNAGLGMDEQFFTEETGIPVYVNMNAMPSIPVDDTKFTAKIKNKLTQLYK